MIKNGKWNREAAFITLVFHSQVLLKRIQMVHFNCPSESIAASALSKLKKDRKNSFDISCIYDMVSFRQKINPV